MAITSAPLGSSSCAMTGVFTFLPGIFSTGSCFMWRNRLHKRKRNPLTNDRGSVTRTCWTEPRPLGSGFSGFIVGFILLQAIGLAQSSVWLIQISAPQTQLISGRPVTLQAFASAESGSLVFDFAPAWRSTNPEVASVDSGGVVRGLLPGISEIEAADPLSGISDRI